MSIIKLTPAFKDYLWGGTKLKENYGKKTDMDPVAESWELSVHPDGPSIVASGEYQGLSFPKYLEKKGKGVLGTKGNTFEFFPILIKFIDAKQPLSIQVHPDNEYALRVEHEYGKTEMWYVVDSLPNACIYYGFSHFTFMTNFITRWFRNTSEQHQTRFCGAMLHQIINHCLRNRVFHTGYKYIRARLYEPKFHSTSNGWR